MRYFHVTLSDITLEITKRKRILQEKEQVSVEFNIDSNVKTFSSPFQEVHSGEMAIQSFPTIIYNTRATPEQMKLKMMDIKVLAAYPSQCHEQCIPILFSPKQRDVAFQEVSLYTLATGPQNYVLFLTPEKKSQSQVAILRFRCQMIEFKREMSLHIRAIQLQPIIARLQSLHFPSNRSVYLTCAYIETTTNYNVFFPYPCIVLDGGNPQRHEQQIAHNLVEYLQIKIPYVTSVHDFLSSSLHFYLWTSYHDDNRPQEPTRTTTTSTTKKKKKKQNANWMELGRIICPTICYYQPSFTSLDFCERILWNTSMLSLIVPLSSAQVSVLITGENDPFVFNLSLDHHPFEYTQMTLDPFNQLIKKTKPSNMVSDNEYDTVHQNVTGHRFLTFPVTNITLSGNDTSRIVSTVITSSFVRCYVINHDICSQLQVKGYVLTDWFLFRPPHATILSTCSPDEQYRQMHSKMVCDPTENAADTNTPQHLENKSRRGLIEMTPIPSSSSSLALSSESEIYKQKYQETYAQYVAAPSTELEQKLFYLKQKYQHITKQ